MWAVAPFSMITIAYLGVERNSFFKSNRGRLRISLLPLLVYVTQSSREKEITATITSSDGKPSSECLSYSLPGESRFYGFPFSMYNIAFSRVGCNSFLLVKRNN